MIEKAQKEGADSGKDDDSIMITISSLKTLRVIRSEE